MTDIDRSMRRPLGTAGIFGTRAEHAWQYDGVSETNSTTWMISIISTHDSLEKIFVPPPLRVNRNLPPVLKIVINLSHRRKRMDGVIVPCCFAGFMVSCTYLDSKGVEHNGNFPLEYVSSVGARDHTFVDWLVYWGQVFGTHKPLADIYIYPDGEDFIINMDRHGKRIMNIEIKKGDLIGAGKNPILSEEASILGLREIPNINFTRYVERCVCKVVPTSVAVKAAGIVKKNWRAEAMVELFNDDGYALGELERVGMGESFIAIGDLPKELYDEENHQVIEYLPVSA